MRPMVGPVGSAAGADHDPSYPPLPVYEAATLSDFSEHLCFLCGRRLTNTRSAEHIFAKWLQERFKLWNEKIGLLSNTSIRYRQQKIPCCKNCNEVHLSKIENKVRRAFDDGIGGVRKLDRLTLLLWLAKIFYGLAYREQFLPFDVKNPAHGPILANLKHLAFIRMLLQGVRTPMKLYTADNSLPATIFIFRLQCLQHPRGNFDFRDDVILKTLFLRMGEVGILTAFDFGAQAALQRAFFERFSRCKLHPLQFEELGARLFYNARLFDRNPAFILVGSDSQEAVTTLMVNPVGGLSSKPIFKGGNGTDFAGMLSRFTGAPLDVLHPTPNQVMTFLLGPDDKYAAMPLRKFSYRGLS